MVPSAFQKMSIASQIRILHIFFKKSRKSLPYKAFRVFSAQRFSISYYHYLPIAEEKYFIFLVM